MKLRLGAIVLAVAACVGGLAHAQPAGAGKQVFDHWCGTCHAAAPRMTGTAALDFKYKGEKPGALEQRTDLTPDVVKYFVRNGISVMAPFRKTEITDAELDALADYLSHTGAAAPKK